MARHTVHPAASAAPPPSELRRPGSSASRRPRILILGSANTLRRTLGTERKRCVDCSGSQSVCATPRAGRPRLARRTLGAPSSVTKHHTQSTTRTSMYSASPSYAAMKKKTKNPKGAKRRHSAPDTHAQCPGVTAELLLRSRASRFALEPRTRARAPLYASALLGALGGVGKILSTVSKYCPHPLQSKLLSGIASRKEKSKSPASSNTLARSAAAR